MMDKDINNGNKEEMSKDTKLICALSYIGILWIVGLIVDRDNPVVKFHVNQGIVLSICAVLARFAIGIVSTILFSIAHMFTIFTSLLSMAFYFIFIAFIIIGILNVYRGDERPLPYIGKMFTIIK